MKREPSEVPLAPPEVAGRAGSAADVRLPPQGPVPGRREPAPAACTATRALWGWSPPPLAAGAKWQLLVDRCFPRSGLRLIIFIATVVALLMVAPQLAARGRLGLDAIAFVAAGTWCALNFARCRHAHCVLTGAGWLALAALAVVEVGLGHSVIDGYEQPAFVGVLVGGLVFEAGWVVSRGTNALSSRLPG
jgi:hypothetical protein